MPLTSEQQNRYRSNLLVEGFSEAQQQQLLDGKVVVVGAGGLGCAALNYLVATGVGHITVIENDVVSLSNLQRQVLYTTPDLGALKARVAAERLSRLNPGCDLHVVTERLTAENAAELLSGYDVVVDCTDNYATRYVMDDFCAAHHLPLVYGTAQGMGGQVAVFHTAGAGGYRALYPDPPVQQPQVGVLSPVVGIVGAMQALQTVKLLCGLGAELAPRLLSMDGATLTFHSFEV